MLASAAQQCEPAVCTLHPPPLAPCPPPPAPGHHRAPGWALRAVQRPPTGHLRHTRWCVHVSPIFSVHPTLSCPSVRKSGLWVSRCVTPDACLTPNLILQKLQLCKRPVHDCPLHPSLGLVPSAPILFFSTKHFITIQDTLYFACLFCWLSSSLL